MVGPKKILGARTIFVNKAFDLMISLESDKIKLPSDQMKTLL